MNYSRGLSFCRDAHDQVIPPQDSQRTPRTYRLYTPIAKLQAQFTNLQQQVAAQNAKIRNLENHQQAVVKDHVPASSSRWLDGANAQLECERENREWEEECQ